MNISFALKESKLFNSCYLIKSSSHYHLLFFFCFQHGCTIKYDDHIRSHTVTHSLRTNTCTAVLSAGKRQLGGIQGNPYFDNHLSLNIYTCNTYLDNHLSVSFHTRTICTQLGWHLLYDTRFQGPCLGLGMRVKI